MATLGKGPASPITVNAGAALTGNQIVQIGVSGLLGIVAGDSGSGDPAAIYTEGVFDLPKQTGFSIALGGAVYVDVGADQRAENNPALPCIGYAIEAAGSSATTVRTRLVQSLSAFGGGVAHKLDGSARPTVDDDAGDGYGVGSKWYASGIVWECLDGTAGAAKWRALNPVLATVTVASGGTSVSTAVGDIPGIANGDHVLASVKTKGANAAYIVGAAVTGGNLVVAVNTDPGTGGAVINCAIWPANVG